MNVRGFSIGVAVLVAGSVSGARADDWRTSTKLVSRGITLPEGTFELSVPVQTSLARGDAGQPTFLNPSAYYGFSDVLTAGVRHFLGVCVSGGDACPQVYNDLSVDAVYRFLKQGEQQWGLSAAMNLAPLGGAAAVSAELGLVWQVQFGDAELEVDPTFTFGLNHRDQPRREGTDFDVGTYSVVTPDEADENRESIDVPVTATLQVTRHLAALAGIGLQGPIDPSKGSFADSYGIPFALGAVVTPMRNLDLGATVTFPDLLGAEGGGGDRVLAVFLAFRG